MLAIRLQRTGRKGHAQFRLIVQDARRTPTSGRFVYLLGSYNPHTKALAVDQEKAAFYLKNGARPSDRAARLLKANGVKLPSWVELEADKERTLRHPEKLRKNRPAGTEAPAKEAPAEETPADAEPVAEAETPAEEAPAETVAEAPAETETPAEAETPEEPTEKPADEAPEADEAKKA